MKELSPWLVEHAEGPTGVPLWISMQCRLGSQGGAFSPVGKRTVKRISDLDEWL